MLIQKKKNIKGIWTFLIFFLNLLYTEFMFYFYSFVNNLIHFFPTSLHSRAFMYYVYDEDKTSVKRNAITLKFTWWGDWGGCGDGLHGAPECGCDVCWGPGLWVGGAWGDCEGGGPKFEWGGPGLAAGDGHCKIFFYKLSWIIKWFF